MSNGRILINADPVSEMPDIGRYLSQGAVVGLIPGFHLPLLGILAHPENGYNIFLIAWLPLFLAAGTISGLFEATIIWACSYITGRRLHFVVRIVCAIALTAISLVILCDLFSDETPTTKEYLIFFANFLPYGVIFGLVIGSGFRPGHELLRGTTPPQRPLANGITGLILRVLVVYALMTSVLILIDLLNRTDSRKEVVFTIIAVSHFMAAAVILFARLPFWLLLPLAVVINVPIAVFITDVLTGDNEIARSIVLTYLLLWAAFVSGRWRSTENEDRNHRRHWFRRQSSDYTTE